MTEREFRAAAELNRYAVEARYPGEWEPIDRKEAEDAVSAARLIRAAARGKVEG